VSINAGREGVHDIGIGIVQKKGREQVARGLVEGNCRLGEEGGGRLLTPLLNEKKRCLIFAGRRKGKGLLYRGKGAVANPAEEIGEKGRSTL